MKHVIFGLVSALLGIWGIIVWWDEFGDVMRGLVPLVLLVIGIIGIMAGLQVQKELDKEDDSLAEEAP
jgi:hypothetical protein